MRQSGVRGTVLHLMNPTSVHAELKKNGFVKLGTLLDLDRVTLLKKETERLLSGSSKPWSDYREFAKGDCWSGAYFAEMGRVSTYLDVIGQSPVVDCLLEELLGREDVQDLLRSVLGLNCRIWYASIRRDEIGSEALRMHRDKPGEVGLSILVDDAPSIAGTTVFLKGSHRWPAIIDYLPCVYPNRIRRYLTGTVGVAGDVFLFYNATWHGRVETDSISRTAMILTFLPESESVNRRPDETVTATLGPVLQSLLRSRQHIKPEPHGIDAKIGPDQYVSRWHAAAKSDRGWLRSNTASLKSALKNWLRHLRALSL